jgi:hypothetical protein
VAIIIAVLNVVDIVDGQFLRIYLFYLFFLFISECPSLHLADNPRFAKLTVTWLWPVKTALEVLTDLL